MTSGSRPSPAADAGHPLPGRVRLVAEGDHVLADGAGAGRGAADHGAAQVRRPHRVAERGAGDDLGQLELVAAGHEDGVDVAEPGRERRVVRLRPRLGSQPQHVAGAQLAEHRVVRPRGSPGPSEDAVATTAIRRPSPPASRTNSRSTTRDPVLSSAPPMTQRMPAGTGLTGRRGTGASVEVAAAQGTMWAWTARRDSWSSSATARPRAVRRAATTTGGSPTAGCDDSAAAGRWLAGQVDRVDHAWVSSARRAQQTWAAVQESLPAATEVVVARDLYQAGPREVVEHARATDVPVQVVVGHNPTLEQVVMSADR